MSQLQLIIGTRNYSSWSLRPWLLLRHLGLEFTEQLLHFDTAEFADAVGRLLPAGRVPVLVHGSRQVWESIAICEYANELADGRGWPAAAALRAEARALAAEMHAGFAALRQSCPMNMRARDRSLALDAATRHDLQRIDDIWSGCRRQHRDGGPWLFGQYSVADAMYAPVAVRCRGYRLPLSARAAEYRDTVLADRHLLAWEELAAAEGVVIGHEEVGDPP